jgi:hypothetical protein
VQAAIAQDFDSAPALKEIDNTAEGTTLLVVDRPALDPGPGTAAVTYIFGAASKRLMHVNAAWTSAPTATAAERNRYTGAGLQLAKPGPSAPLPARDCSGIGSDGLFAGKLLSPSRARRRQIGFNPAR